MTQHHPSVEGLLGIIYCKVDYVSGQFLPQFQEPPWHLIGWGQIAQCGRQYAHKLCWS